MNFKPDRMNAAGTLSNFVRSVPSYTATAVGEAAVIRRSVNGREVRDELQ